MAMCSFVPCCLALPGVGYARGGGRAAGCTREAPHAAPAMEEPRPRCKPSRLPRGHPNPHSCRPSPLRHDVPDSHLMQQCHSRPSEPRPQHQNCNWPLRKAEEDAR
jgi:hypothetical protein